VLSKSKNAADRDDPVSITRQVSQRVTVRRRHRWRRPEP